MIPYDFLFIEICEYQAVWPHDLSPYQPGGSCYDLMAQSNCQSALLQLTFHQHRQTYCITEPDELSHTTCSLPEIMSGNYCVAAALWDLPVFEHKPSK